MIPPIVDLAVNSAEIIAVAIPLPAPIRMAGRQVATREYVLAIITTPAGVVGCGYGYVATGQGKHAARLLEAEILPTFERLLKSARPLSPLDLSDHFARVDSSPLTLQAVAALEVAVWDILSKRAGVSLSHYLGAVNTEVSAYVTGGYYRAGNALLQLEEELMRYADLGFESCKIKVGGAPVAEDVARVALAREILGPHGRLALDANNAWQSVDDVMRFVNSVEQYSIWWLEEPLDVRDHSGYERLAGISSIPIAIGENCHASDSFQESLRISTRVILQPDALVLGGVGQWLWVAQVAAQAGASVAPHAHPHLHCHLAAAVDNCIAVEYFVPEFGFSGFDLLLEEPLRAGGGKIVLSEEPGLGINFDREAVLRYQI